MLRKFILLTVCVLTLGLGLAGAAAAAQTLRLGFGDPMESDQGALAQRFKTIVEQMTDGQVRIELFPNCALGTETEMLQNTRMGTLDMACIGVGNAVPFVKELGTLSMPYLIEDAYDAAVITTGALGEMWNDYAVQKGGFRIIGWTYSNFRYVTNSKRPVHTLADIKGLKIRVPHNQILLETFKSWGANPVPMDWAETFTGLQQGVIDGQENPYIVNYTSKFHEVQKYITEVHYQYSLQPLIYGVRSFNKLSPELQQILIQAGLEAQTYELLFQTLEAEKAKKAMQDAGMEVCILKDEEQWKRIAVETVWPKMYDFIGGKAVLDKTLQLMGKE